MATRTVRRNPPILLAHDLILFPPVMAFLFTCSLLVFSLPPQLLEGQLAYIALPFVAFFSVAAFCFGFGIYSASRSLSAYHNHEWQVAPTHYIASLAQYARYMEALGIGTSNGQTAREQLSDCILRDLDKIATETPEKLLVWLKRAKSTRLLHRIFTSAGDRRKMQCRFLRTAHEVAKTHGEIYQLAIEYNEVWERKYGVPPGSLMHVGFNLLQGELRQEKADSDELATQLFRKMIRIDSRS